RRCMAYSESSGRRRGGRHRARDLQNRERAGREIGIFNLDGEYFALANRCPHAGGPWCLRQGLAFWRKHPSQLRCELPVEQESKLGGGWCRCVGLHLMQVSRRRQAKFNG